MSESELGVPADLLGLRDDLVRRIKEVDAEIGTLQASRNMIDAQLFGVTRSIQIVAVAFPSVVDLAPATSSAPAKKKATSSTGGAGAAPSPGVRATRRNVEKLIRGELKRWSDDGAVWVKVKTLIKDLSLQKSQVDRALGKLGEEVDWDRETGHVRLHYEEPKGEPSAPEPPPVNQGDVVYQGGVELTTVTDYLSKHPEGVAMNDLLALGYSRAHVMIAVGNGTVWQDARGNFRPTIKAAPAVDDDGQDEAAQ